MKKLISIILTAALIALAALSLSGCDRPSARIRSVMNVDPSFGGTRTVTVVYPLSVDIDLIKDAIIEGDPTADTAGASFAYKGVEEDGYYFELSFDFSDRAEYEAQISAVAGRPVTALLSVKDTVLTKGVRMTENCDIYDLVGWITRVTDSVDATKDIGFTCEQNTVTVGSKTYTVSETVDVNDVQGSTVSALSVRTSNDRKGRYDRTFVFTVPNSSYISSKDSFEEYFLTNTAPQAGYYGWTAEGANMLYTVIYEDLSVEELRDYTAMLLDTDSVEISYGDSDNTSTPLMEGMVFEESLDTFSFIGPDQGAPVLNYSYSLPASTTHGDGAVYKDGSWVTEGRWEEGVYKAELSSGSMQLRVPDGVPYSINGVDFYLDSLGDGRFRRTTSFLYSKSDGFDGMNYAADFFTAHGAQAVTGEDDDNLICSVVCEGAAPEITDELVRLFGSGNFMAYRASSAAFALSKKTEFVDYVNLSSILNSSNAARPMRYYISSPSSENIVSVSVDGAESAYSSAAKSALELKGGVGTVEYKGNIPITSNILIYSLFGAALTAAVILIAVLLLRRRKGRKPGAEAQKVIDSVLNGEEDSEAADYADLSQTTTFSIFELRKRRRDRQVEEEIDRDIKQRMEEQQEEEPVEEKSAEQPAAAQEAAPASEAENETAQDAQQTEAETAEAPAEDTAAENAASEEPVAESSVEDEELDITGMLEEAREALEREEIAQESDPDGSPDPLIALLDTEDEDV